MGLRDGGREVGGGRKRMEREKSLYGKTGNTTPKQPTDANTKAISRINPFIESLTRFLILPLCGRRKWAWMGR